MNEIIECIEFLTIFTFIGLMHMAPFYILYWFAKRLRRN